MRYTQNWLVGLSVFLACIFNGLASAQTVQAPMFPKYIVLGVVYAPPGSSSSVTYSDSSVIGSTDSIQQQYGATSITSTSTTVGGGLFGLGSKTTKSSSDGWTTALTNNASVTIQTTQGNSIATQGPISAALGVNHDNDIIYVLLNPAAVFTVSTSPGSAFNIAWSGASPMASNGCDLSSSSDSVSFYQVVNGCDPNQYPFPDIVGVPVWCLKNPYYPGRGCSQWLNYTQRPWDQSYWGPVNPNQSGPYPSLPAGLTLQDYADILQTDPFVALNGGTINVCHPSFGPNEDPNDPDPYQGNPAGNPALYGKISLAPIPTQCGLNNGTTAAQTRFLPYGSVQYPEPGPNGLPSTYTGTFSYSNITQTGLSASDTHTMTSSVSTTVGFENSLGVSFPGPFGSGLGFTVLSFQDEHTNGSSNEMTWQNTTSSNESNQQTSSASYSITGPQLSDNYNGPATYDVYLDNIYGTYAFYSSLTPKVNLGTIGVAPSSLAFYTNGVGQASTPTQVTLTNNSQYPLTMVFPAITFSDSGFQLIEGDSNHPDSCSNQYLLPYGVTSGLQTYTCTAWVEFLPVLADAPNPITLQNQGGVQATMIAAGTENASSFQNILVTAQTPVSGVMYSSDQQGATLIANDSSISTINPVPNVYDYPTLVVPFTTAMTETFTFTNYYSTGVTLQAQPGQSSPFTVSDSLDFGLVQGSQNPCTAGMFLARNQTCTVNLALLPSSANTSAGIFTYGTNLIVSGSIGTSTVVQPLATAGAWGQGLLGITINPTDLGLYGGIGDQTFSITNNSPSQSLTLVISNGGGDYIAFDSSACSAGLAPLASCNVTVFDPGYGSATLTGIISVVASGAGGSYAAQVHVTEQQAHDPGPGCQLQYCTEFAPASANQSQTVAAGGTALYAFQLTPGPGGYVGTVSFSATGLPPGAVATFSPSTIAVNAGPQIVYLSIKTAPPVAALTSPALFPAPGKALWALLLLPLTWAGRTRRLRTRLTMLCSAVLLCSGLFLSTATLGCGSASSSPAVPAPAVPQSYTIAVTMTSGPVTKVIDVPITVQ